MSELEIRDELKDKGVVGVHRVTVRKNGEVIPTGTLFLTLNRPDLPKEIIVGYLRVKVELFAPNPLRCFNSNGFWSYTCWMQDDSKVCQMTKRET